jgi:quercetin dioxygenase-like cupin family protein
MEPMQLWVSAHERLTVVADGPEQLVLEARWDPHAPPPPRHLHPAQREDFEVLAGTLQVEIAGQEQAHAAGASFTIPAGVVHRMWNPFPDPVRVRWVVTPAGRTLAMFGELDALHRDGRGPGKLALGRVVARYGAEFQLVGPAGRVLGLLAR